MKQVFITSDLPYFILYNKLEQIDPRLNTYYPYTKDIEIDLRSTVTRIMYELDTLRFSSLDTKSKRFLALLKTNKKQIEQHIHIEKYWYDNNERHSTYINLDTQELDAYLAHKAYCHLSNRLMSESLYKTLREAIKELNKVESGRKSALYSQLTYQANTAYSLKDTRCYTLNTQGKMTFLKTNNTCYINNNDKWTTTNRQEIKIGRALRNILNRSLIKYTDNEIEQIHNHLVAQYTFSATFEVVKGEQLKESYLYENYAANQGSLNQSCMKYSECQDYLDFYTINPDKVSLLVAKREGYIVGRALLWKPDNSEEIIMDRIYGSDITIEAFKNYATEHGYVYKLFQNHSSSNDFVGNQKPYYEITMTMSTQAPYMDSFKYYDHPYENTYITVNTKNGDYALTNTDGNYAHDDDENYVTLEDGDRVHEDDAAYSSWTDGYIHQEDAVWSNYHDTYLHTDWEHTMINGDYVMIEDDEVVYDEYNEQYIFRDEATYLEETSQYVHETNARLAIGTNSNVIYEETNSATPCSYNREYLTANAVDFDSIQDQDLITKEDNYLTLYLTRDAHPESALSYLQQRYPLTITVNAENNE